MLKKKIWANFQRIIWLFTQKIVTKLSKIWVWDPRSGIRKKPIPDPGVKKAPDPGSGSATLVSRYRTQVTRIRITLIWIRIRLFFRFDADPYPTLHLVADSDPTCHFYGVQIRFLVTPMRICKPRPIMNPPVLHCKPPRPLNCVTPRLQKVPSWLHCEPPQLQAFHLMWIRIRLFTWCESGSCFSTWCGSRSGFPNWRGSLRIPSRNTAVIILHFVPGNAHHTSETIGSTRFLASSYLRYWY